MSVTVERRGAAAVVTLRWTETRNALDPDRAAALGEALVEAGRLPEVGAVVLTGEGAFCSGGDLPVFSRLGEVCSAEEMAEVVYGKVHAVFRALRDCPLPTVAALDGGAIGLGFDLALACDMRFVGPDGWVQQGWSRAGLIAAGAGGWFLAARAPQLQWDLLLSQDRLGPAECAAHGLGTAASEGGRAAALAAAETLADLPLNTRAGYVRLHRLATWPSDDYLVECARLQAELLRSPEFRTRSRALLAMRTRSA